MTKTIDELCDQGIHQAVQLIGVKEAGQSEFAIGNCYYCTERVIIGNQYRHVEGKVYELIQLERQVNAKECRE